MGCHGEGQRSGHVLRLSERLGSDAGFGLRLVLTLRLACNLYSFQTTYSKPLHGTFFKANFSGI